MIANQSYSQALDAAKTGKRIAREGWNGKGMWVAVGAVTSLLRLNGGSFPHTTVRPCLVMLDAQGMLVPGWLASQTDMLADDWVILD